jgi:hypothetical protein
MMRGVQTANVMEVMRPVVESRQTLLVHDAIRRYRNMEKRYTNEEAMLFVASLVANQDIIDDLERIVRDGQKAGQHFVK